MGNVESNTPGAERIAADVIRSFKKYRPTIHPTAYVHPSAEVIGRVDIGAHSSIWPGCVLRADADRILIGAGTNVQDGTVIHCDPGIPTVIGRHVVIGHRALIHGAVIDDDVLIGMGAIVMAAKIGRWSLVGSGALVLDGVKIPPRCLVLGSPAKIVRPTGPKEIAMIRRGAKNYIERQKSHRQTSLIITEA